MIKMKALPDAYGFVCGNITHDGGEKPPLIFNILPPRHLWKGQIEPRYPQIADDAYIVALGDEIPFRLATYSEVLLYLAAEDRTLNDIDAEVIG